MEIPSPKHYHILHRDLRMKHIEAQIRLPAPAPEAEPGVLICAQKKTMKNNRVRRENEIPEKKS